MSDHAGDAAVLIVVPTMGTRPDYIAETFDSLDAQAGVRLTVAVVAPAGADAARAECERRGYVFVAQTGRGMSNAINEGWLAAGQGAEFWAWLGDDDLLTPDSLLVATEHLRRRARAAMVFGRCRYIDDEGRPIFEVRPGRMAAVLLRWGPDLVPQPGSLARASAVRAAGVLDESLRYAMDLDLFLRLRAQGTIDYLPTVLGAFRWHAGSTTVSGRTASDAEARQVRRRTRIGWRRVGWLLEPAAMALGRVHHRLQKHTGTAEP